MFAQIEAGLRFSIAGNDKITAKNLVHIGCNVISNTGRFTIGCHAWRQLPSANKTWPAFKTHFKAANTDLHLTATTESAGFHGAANSLTAQTTSEALAASQAALATSQAALAAALQGQANVATTACPVTAGDRSYCWTHGFGRNANHTSTACLKKADGHQASATGTNKMGGSTKVWTHRT
jgi:hypothetical protein